MNNKKTLYWAIGVIVVLLIIFLFWGMNRGKQGDSKIPPSQAPSLSQAESGAGSGTDPHAGMNHGTAQESGAGAGSGDTGYTRYLAEETAIMDRMMREMELPDETGNSALDFIDGMIPHHEAAVSMAESYLANGGAHEKLKPLAEDIITAQKAEISQMEDMKKAISDSGKTDREKADAYRKEYEKMMAGHHESHGTTHDAAGHGASGDANSAGTGSIDAAFAEGMIMHHQMAVDMAKAILDNTDEEDVLTLSRQIIDAQEEEISLMQKVLQDS